MIFGSNVLDEYLPCIRRVNNNMKFGEMHSSSNRGNLRGLKNRLYPGLVVSATVLSILMTSTSDAQLTYRELPGIGDQNKLRSIEVR